MEHWKQSAAKLKAEAAAETAATVAALERKHREEMERLRRRGAGALVAIREAMPLPPQARGAEARECYAH